VGENTPTRSNRPPTPGISPKWVIDYFSQFHEEIKMTVSNIICVRSGLAHSDNTQQTHQQ